jgi:hypothetical protein
MLYEEFYDAADADLFVVAEGSNQPANSSVPSTSHATFLIMP